MTHHERIQLITSRIRDVPDFPKPGIMFKDITPLLADPVGFSTVLDLFTEQWAHHRPEVIVGIEARGFIFGGALASRMKVSFVPARKRGKLPAETIAQEYDLEYGTDTVEIHADAFRNGARVLIVDDLIATGGTAWATAKLVGRLGGDLLGAAFVVELSDLGGAARLAPLETHSLIRY